MKSKLIVLLSITLLVWLAPTTARTYRWVDENGVTIYSQSPPPSGEATIIKTPPPSPAEQGDETMKNLKARLDALDESKKKENEAKEKQEEEARNAATKKQNCESATKNLTELETHQRVRLKMDDGRYRILSDEERRTEIENARKGIEDFCD